MKQVLTLLAAFVLSFSFAQELPVTVTDTTGQTIELSKLPERIVVTSHLHLFDLLSIGVVPVGAEYTPPTQYLGFEEAIAQELMLRGMEVPNLGGTTGITNADWSVDWERVAALQPDLIVVADSEQAQIAEAVAPAYSTYASLPDGTDSLEMVESAFLGLATAVGKTAEAEAFLAKMRGRIEAYEALAPGDRTVLITYSDGQGSVGINGNASLTCQLWQGFAECVAPERLVGWLDASVEALVEIDPDVLVILGPCYGPECEKENAALVGVLAEQPLWDELTAVREKRVHVAPFDFRAYSAATLGHLYDATAPMIYPETFPEPLTDAEVQDILVGSE